MFLLHLSSFFISIMSIKGFVGCMFSGKTSSMQSEAERLERSGKRVVFLKHSSDTRYDPEGSEGPKDEGRKALVRSHNGDTRQAYAVNSLILDKLPLEVLVAISGADVICIDELQFMDGAVDFCLNRVKVQRKHILFAALDGDFNMNPFPSIAELLPKCEKFKKLHAVCVECGQRASFSRKIAGDTTKIIEVGGADMYVPTCRVHHSSDFPISDSTIERMRTMNQRIMSEKK